MTDLRYPVGLFSFEEPVSEAQRLAWIKKIAALPGHMRNAVVGLGEDQLETPYRNGGWTVRQVVHHVADSHLNSTVRFRWALTEDTPAIKAYDETRWAELPDAKTAPVELSLGLLESLHNRWVYLLKALDDEAFERSFVHPETGKEISLQRNLALYAWHGRHHCAHITALRERKGW